MKWSQVICASILIDGLYAMRPIKERDLSLRWPALEPVSKHFLARTDRRVFSPPFQHDRPRTD
jgi:hypothetical protein